MSHVSAASAVLKPPVPLLLFSQSLHCATNQFPRRCDRSWLRLTRRASRSNVKLLLLKGLSDFWRTNKEALQRDCSPAWLIRLVDLGLLLWGPTRPLYRRVSRLLSRHSCEIKVSSCVPPVCLGQGVLAIFSSFFCVTEFQNGGKKKNLEAKSRTDPNSTKTPRIYIFSLNVLLFLIYILFPWIVKLFHIDIKASWSSTLVCTCACGFFPPPNLWRNGDSGGVLLPTSSPCCSDRCMRGFPSTLRSCRGRTHRSTPRPWTRRAGPSSAPADKQIPGLRSGERTPGSSGSIKEVGLAPRSISKTLEQKPRTRAKAQGRDPADWNTAT